MKKGQVKKGDYLRIVKGRRIIRHKLGASRRKVGTSGIRGPAVTGVVAAEVRLEDEAHVAEILVRRARIRPKQSHRFTPRLGVGVLFVDVLGN